MFKEAIKTTVCDIIVVFLLVLIVTTGISIFGKEYFNEGKRYIAMFETIASKNKTTGEELKIDPVKKLLNVKPQYETQFGTIKIEKIDSNLPLFFGDTDKVLAQGVGMSPNGYFPGEGGTIIAMAHNFDRFYIRLGEVAVGDKIQITTSYGDYTYEVYETKIIKETDLGVMRVQDEEEILYVYTCYPFGNIGYTTQRYLVSAKLVEEV